jgi:phytoene dehydrogenase-like protein
MSVIVIGGGHNGLTAAITLAKAGRAVTVLERRDVLGGVAAGETFGDFQTRGLLDESCTVRPSVVATLGLANHGLRWRERPPLYGAQKDGEGLLLGASIGAAELGDDALGYRTLRALIQRLGPTARRILEAAPPNIGDDAKIGPLLRPAFDLRRLGKSDLMELLRVAPACVDDWVTEEVGGPLLRAMLCAEALPGTWMGPRSPTSTTTLLLAEALADREVEGGPAALVSALASAAQAAGVTVRTGVTVQRIVVEAGAVTGVETSEGRIPASVVLSAIGPKTTLLDLLHPLDLPAHIERDVSDIRTRGTLAKVHLGLSQPLILRKTSHERMLLGAEDPLDLERGWDHAKHRRIPTNPPLYIRQWTDGGHVASITVHCAAHDLDGGWTDEARDSLYAAVLDTLVAYVPGVQDSILASETLTPADIEARYSLPGGHVFHGELALDQLGPLRPTPRLAQYATPIGGLFLGSAGMHPGIGITCAPGHLAAQRALTLG